METKDNNLKFGKLSDHEVECELTKQPQVKEMDCSQLEGGAKMCNHEVIALLNGYSTCSYYSLFLFNGATSRIMSLTEKFSLDFSSSLFVIVV